LAVRKNIDIDSIKARIFSSIVSLLDRLGLDSNKQNVEIIYLYIIGYDAAQIADVLKTDEASVKKFLETPQVKDALGEISSILASIYIDEILLFLTRGSLAALSHLLDALENSEDPRVKLDVAKFILDRMIRIMMTQKLRLKESEPPNIEIAYSATLFDELK